MKIPAKIIKAVQDNNSFLAHAHIGPDPDSVGSILALKLGLESIGKIVHLFSEDNLPPSTDFLSSVESIENIQIDNALTYQHDAYLCLDTAKWGLATHQRPVPQFSSPIINIDHHPDNNIKTNLTWINPKSSSVSEMIYYLFKNLKINITSEIATCLILGVLYDTYNLQNTNVTSQTLKLVAKLITAGGQYQQSLFSLTRSYSPSQLKIWTTLLTNMQFSADKTFFWTTLSHQQLSLTKNSGSGGFANAFLGRIQGTNFGALLIEKQPNLVQGSLRARKDVDVSQIAHLLGGGGHKAAAGFRLEKSLKQAEKQLLSVINSLQEKGKL